MLLRINGLLLAACFLCWQSLAAQRTYAPQSVLATGSWYKIAVSQPGMYRMDVPFLASLGINTANLSAAAIRLFGNGGQMLPESNASPRTDDLAEVAIQIEDGGDNILNGNDYILFYAPGPHRWVPDPATQRFRHENNIYSNRAYYFLSIGGTGRRVTTIGPGLNPPITVTQYSGRYVHELDTINFLASGKEWYGEEFTDAPGKSLARRFTVNFPDLIVGSNVQLHSSFVSRSVGTAGRFDIRLNESVPHTLSIPATGAGLYDPFAHAGAVVTSGTGNGPAVNIDFTYIPGSFNAQGWLNWFELFFRSQLTLGNRGQVDFRDLATVGQDAVTFIINEAGADTKVWDVTDPSSPVQVRGLASGNQYRFNNSSLQLREYVAVHGNGHYVPEALGRVGGQNLHQSSPADHIIITYPPFAAQAERLATFHRNRDNLRVVVVTTDQVYNEFSSGSPDPTALRDFVKMYFDRYGSDPTNRPRYLLLFGDASYDYRNKLSNNTNFVPCYQNNVTLDLLSTYTTDDYFGFLNDNEDINGGSVLNLLDIGIGRVPAKNITEATNFVDKVEAYYHASSFGPWRNNLTFIADDEDQNLHLQDAEIITGTTATVAPVFERQKIYLDAYRQESGSAGSTYPGANQAIDNQVLSGTLLWNYTGHGGPRRLAEETILDQDIVNGWKNENRLPLFLTATCDFAPYDNPLIHSLGENILLRPKTGAIALMTTTRIVFSFSNRVMNNNYVQFALQADANNNYRRLGDAIKDAKNHTYQTSGDITNNRKFTLLGDPAMHLAFPTLKVKPTFINGKPSSQVDTMSATEKITVEGEVTDAQGNLLSGFNGAVYPAVFDKPQPVATLGNDPTSPVTNFTTQNNILFKGKASVAGGKFKFTFRVPRDINYRPGNGRLGLYAENGEEDGNGFFEGFVVAGTHTGTDDDQKGPEIKPYLNDEKFVNGGLTNENPVLLLKLADSSGINTAGTGIGHDLVATLDNDNDRFFVLNDFYESELDNYQKGTVRFQLPELEPGPHTLKIKAWDVLNNSAEAILDFTVAKDETLTLSHVLNYPNPFTTRTSFWFEHNKPGQDLVVRLQIFTLTGRVIKVFQKTINTPGNRSSDLEWDGRDEFGDRIGRGVYLYKLSVTAPGKLKKEKIEKLVIF